MAAKELANSNEEKVFHEHTRAMYAHTRETLRKSMDRISSSISLERKDESNNLQSAVRVKSEFAKSEVGDEESMHEAKELRKLLMEERAKCISSGFSTAAKVFTESIELATKMISKYEKTKREE